jgi:hypothetical protein
MALYEYQCRTCGQVDSITHPIEPDWNPPQNMGECPNGCGTILRRVYTLQIAKVMQEHYNSSVGKTVSSMRGYKDDLKRASEAATLKTGIPHNYVATGGSESTALTGIDPKTAPDLIRMDRERLARGVKDKQKALAKEWRDGPISSVKGESARKARESASK